MIGGQVVDIISEGKRISKDELNYMHLKKTGELIKIFYSCRCNFSRSRQKMK